MKIQQEDVNRFLDLNYHMAPTRTAKRRLIDLALRFDEASSNQVALMFDHWLKRGPKPPLAEIQKLVG